AIRPTSAEAVAELRADGVKTLMLTGDNPNTAAVIAAKAGIDDVRAGLLPEDKEAALTALRESGEIAAMVGDGINDAPALAKADIGISMGAGTDIALRSSDIVLLRDDPADLPTAIRLSRAVLRNIKQNFFWALFYNALCIPLAAGAFSSLLGWELSPVYAAAAMSVSSLFVVGNSLRLRFFKPVRKANNQLKTEKGE
ncbi:MAG: HAD-IC family P-type ATPase, partial [Clostridia bacterium]|nr:HAD-IC family P-type ATPase [Clostridia bacterium]